MSTKAMNKARIGKSLTTVYIVLQVLTVTVRIKTYQRNNNWDKAKLSLQYNQKIKESMIKPTQTTEKFRKIQATAYNISTKIIFIQ